MLRTLFFAGAFPLFNNVDEVFHIDLVIRREMGLPTRPNEPIGEATRDLELRYGTGLGLEGRQIRFYWSPEYVDPRLPTGEVPLPFWTAPATVQNAFGPRAKALWPTRRNHEAFEPPLYYAIAARWLVSAEVSDLVRPGSSIGFGPWTRSSWEGSSSWPPYTAVCATRRAEPFGWGCPCSLRQFRRRRCTRLRTTPSLRSWAAWRPAPASGCSSANELAPAMPCSAAPRSASRS